MDLWDLTRLLLRRWYFAVPMLLASVAVVVVAAQHVSPDYKSEAYMQLIPAPSTGKPIDPKAKNRPTNPWNDLGYAALGNAAALTVTDQTSLDKLAAKGYSDSVTVVLNERTPLFEIEAVGDSKQQAAGTAREVIRQLQADIAAKQKQYGTVTEDTITTLVINDGSAPSVESGKIKRILIVAAGLGILITTASTIALDYWLRRRRARRDATGDENASVVSKPVSAGGGARAAESRPDPLESAEKTHVMHPQHANGNVYTGERRKADVQARATPAPANGNGNGNNKKNAEPEGGVDATVVLPASHLSWRNQEKKP